MASIGGLSSKNALNSTSSLRGIGGLASGLDRDTLIENMTYGTRSKIAKQLQQKQKISWGQDAMRSITDKMYKLVDKFTSYTSSTNLMSSNMFSRNLITALGTNSNKISVTGTAAGAETMSILGVKQLAKDAQVTTADRASAQLLSTGAISNDLSEEVKYNDIAGNSLFIKVGNQSYNVVLSDVAGMDFKTTNPAEILDYAAKSINQALAGTDSAVGGKLDTSVEAKVIANKLVLVNKDPSGNTVELEGSTGNLLTKLGFMSEGENFGDLSEDRKKITAQGLTATGETKIASVVTHAKLLSGKEITFTYNGKAAKIKLGDFTDGQHMTDVQADLQDKLDKAFGKNRIEVKYDANGDDKLTFRTTLPQDTDSNGNLKTDTSSTLAIDSAGGGILGKGGIFGIDGGTTNRVSLSSRIADSGLAGASALQSASNMDEFGFSINGKDFKFSKNTSIKDIIKEVNESDAGVTLSYQSGTDRFLIKSKETGASGEITLGSGNTGDPSVRDGLKILFGDSVSTQTVKGQDAEVLVKYANTNEEVWIKRGSNSFSVDGLNIGLKSEFGIEKVTDAGGNEVYQAVSGQEVTFNAEVDTETTTKAVKEMITAFNEILEIVLGETSQKPNRDYEPLTDEQKAEMSETQIEKWEKEAKKGLFFNDTDMRGLTDSLRFILPNDARAAFSKMGITVSTDYKDGGKLVFDEETFKTVLQQDPDAVKDLFTRNGSVNADGTKTDDGLMVKIQSAMNRYAGTKGATKGILIERAGSIYAPLSVLSNSMQKQMDAIDKTVKQLQTKLKTEQNRYIQQFTSLETLISQMNSQSSYLGSMFSS